MESVEVLMHAQCLGTAESTISAAPMIDAVNRYLSHSESAEDCAVSQTHTRGHFSPPKALMVPVLLCSICLFYIASLSLPSASPLQSVQPRRKPVADCMLLSCHRLYWLLLLCLYVILLDVTICYILFTWITLRFIVLLSCIKRHCTLFLMLHCVILL